MTLCGKEGRGGRGTHILYVRYIILLQNGRQAEQRKSHRKKNEGLRDRLKAGRQLAHQPARDTYTEVGFTD